MSPRQTRSKAPLSPDAAPARPPARRTGGAAPAPRRRARGGLSGGPAPHRRERSRKRHILATIAVDPPVPQRLTMVDVIGAAALGPKPADDHRVHRGGQGHR